MSNMISPIEYEQMRHVRLRAGFSAGEKPAGHLLTSTVVPQGPTSSGKTSLVEYLARRTGHTCVPYDSSCALGSALLGAWQ